METWVQVLIRSILIFALLLAAVRFMGKRSIVRITPFHMVSYIVIAVLTALVSANVITNPILGLISLGVWVISTILLEYLALKSKWVHDVIYGKETVLIKHGRIMEQSLLKARLTGDELLRALRAKNAFSLETQDQQAKQTFQQLAQTLDDAVVTLKGRQQYIEEQEPQYKQQ